MIKLFSNLYLSIKKWRVLFFILVLGFVSSCIYLAFQINFEEDITKMLPKGENTDITAKVMNQLNFSDKISVMIKADAPEHYEELPDLAQQFIEYIQKDSSFFTEIQGEVSNDDIEETFDFIYENLPLFLEEKDYQEIQAQLHQDSIEARMQNNYTTLISPTGIVARNFILKDPLGLSFKGLNHLREMGVSKDFIIENGFLHSADTSTLLLFITPANSGTDTKRNEEFVNHLYHFQEQFNQENKGVAELSYFGAPFVAQANADQIEWDIKSTVFISLTILMLILVFFYRQIYVPLVLFIPAIIGASTALAFLYLTHDSISAISISIGAILIGITVDYPLHVITHFRESSDIKLLYKNITKPVLASSLTTATAFLCLIFVNSEVLNDLGIFAFITILISALSALIVIPHLYLPKTKKKETFIDKIAAYKYEKNRILLLVTFIFVGIGFFALPRVQFNSNIADLNYVPEDLQKSEEQFENIGSSGKKSIYLTVYGENLDDVLSKNYEIEKKLAQLYAAEKIADYSSIGKFLLSAKEQAKKIQEWEEFWKNNDPNKVIEDIETSSIELGFNAGTFIPYQEYLTSSFSTLTLDEYKSLKILNTDEFLTQKDGFITLSTLVKTEEEHYDEIVKILSNDQVLLIDRKNLSEEFLGQIRDDFKSLINYSFLAVFLIIWFFFKRIEIALVAIISILLTGVITASFIYLLGLELNVFSTIVTTLVIGLGVDFSIFMTSAMQKRYTYGKDELATYRTSIILAVLTTVLAVGVLIFAKHPALKSVSSIALIGLTSALVLSFNLYPILFQFFFDNRPRKGRSPVNLRLLISAILSFGYFGTISFLTSLFGILIFPLVPVKRERKMLWYRKTIARLIKSVMYSNYGVKNKLVNPHHEKFEEPAIIIANHSSFLDTLSMGFLPVPFIFMVNDWVYHSPVFGKAVQAAGYYPTNTGVKGIDENLAKIIKDGAYLAVFPEGTRSYTGAIARFHKGAFLLAQKYQIDIIPLYIHGNFNLLPKNDFIIYDGEHYLEIGKRIKFTENQKEENTKEITKEISHNFKAHFQSIREEKEGIDYFKQKIELNFLYKLPAIVAQAKEEYTKNRELYFELNTLFEEDEKIFRIGNDLGIWDLMLTLQQAHRDITTYIENEDYRAVAQQSYLLSLRKIEYVDSIAVSKDGTLFITATIEESHLKNLLKQNKFSKVILLKNTVDEAFFTTFNYQILEKRENYYLLKAN